MKNKKHLTQEQEDRVACILMDYDIREYHVGFASGKDIEKGFYLIGFSEIKNRNMIVKIDGYGEVRS